MKKYVWPCVSVLCVTLGIVIGMSLSRRAGAGVASGLPTGGVSSSTNAGKMQQLLMLMDQAYVDSLDMDSITDQAMQQLVEKLDPHSAYIPASDLEMVNSQLAGSFSGIGIQFTIQQDTIGVVAVIAGGPSERVGLLAGDKIITVDDSLFVGKGINNERVMHTLRGEKGTEVTLGIQRAGTDELLHYTITRGDIPVNSVDAKFIIDQPSNPGKTATSQGQKVGFVRVNKFGETTYDEFIAALAELRARGADSYIIDLRENSGGFMEQAIRMANEFLDRGQRIVYAEGRAYPRYEATANGRGRFRDVKLAVLIDDFSASASEIFAGAMQDNDRATIVGRRSFGKGLVQQQVPFDDGSAVRLTVARYYTPSGRCIQKPYTLGDQDEYELEMLERYEHGEMFSADSVHLGDSTVYRTIGGRIVYGGGGIMPDIFVGRDTTQYSPWFNRVVNHAYTYQFAYQYTNQHRQTLSRYTDWQSMERYLQQQNLLPEVVAFAQQKGIQPVDREIQQSRTILLRLVHAYIVRDMLGDAGFFPLFERDDEITRRALQVLQSGQ